MPHCEARGGEVIHLMNRREAACWAGVLFLKMWKLPPPVGEPRRLPAGSMATPNSNLALFFTLVRLPVVVHIIAVFFSKKSFGVVPHSITPGAITLCFWPRSTQYCSASTTAGLSKNVCVPASFINKISFWVVKPWKSQYGNPDEGTWTPHWVACPLASCLVSFLACSTCSAQVAGGLLGSSPASLNASLFQYRTIVERWNGMPHVLPPVRLLSMKAGKKLASHALSSAVLITSSKGITASSSISVNMSVESRIAVCGASPLLTAVSTLTIVSW